MKRTIFLCLLLLLRTLGGHAQQMARNQLYQDYFEQYAALAVEQMVLHKIPASITLAQGVLESGAGRSELARVGNNHFGIKCNGWTGRKTYHDDDARNECFRAYASVYESYEDHSKFLVGSQRYRSLFSLKKTDYKGWAKGLKACGYATSPTYATRLIEIIELYKLYQYDKVEKYDKFQADQLRHGDRRHVYEFNKNYYVVAKKGDTFPAVASDVNISYKRLAKYNERSRDDMLEEGEYVWLKKKRSNAPREYKGVVHKVQADESMYSISQKYGIRLKSLYKMNQLPPDYMIRVGDLIKIR